MRIVSGLVKGTVLLASITAAIRPSLPYPHVVLSAGLLD